MSRENRSPPPLFKHQIDSVKFMSTRSRVLDVSSPGTGKSRVQIELFATRRKRGGGAALVIAPKSLLRSAWQDDFQKFAPEMQTIVTPAEKREQAFAQVADVYITNTDATKWLAQQPASFFKRFDTLIIDELSSFKHHTSQRSKAINKIKKYFSNRYGLTGTPNANSITDIWHQVFILDDGQRLGKSFYKFRNSVCQPRQVGPQPNMLQWEDKPGAELAVGHLLADMVVRHKFEECLDIPENHTYSVPYHMSPKQAKAYQQMEKAAITQLTNGAIVSAVNAAGVMTKLLQIACLAGDTEVLCRSGWRTLSSITEEQVWDGQEWVSHSGLALKGTAPTIDCYGVRMTPEHLVLTTTGWRDGKSSEKFDRADVRLPDSYATIGHDREHSDPVRDVGMPMPLRQRSNTTEPVSTRTAPDAPAQLRMPTREPNARDVPNPAVLQMVRHARSLLQPAEQRLQKLGRSWNNGLRKMAGVLRKFLYGYGGIVPPEYVIGAYRQQQGVQSSKLPLGNCFAAGEQHPLQRDSGHPSGSADRRTSGAGLPNKTRHPTSADSSVRMEHAARVEPVYDLVNCGPRHRFVVRCGDGVPMIVHNSGASYSEEGTGDSPLKAKIADALGYAPIDSGRYELVADLVEQRDHSVVFFNWAHQRDLLVKEFKKRGITYAVIDGNTSDKARKEAVDHFQAGFYRVLLAHPQSAAHGLTLTKGTATIWASPTYNLEHFLQGNRRIYRAGQTQKTETIMVLAPGTVEDKVLQKLQDKDVRQGNMLDLLKELFHEKT